MVVGHDEAVTRLALAGVRHSLGLGGQRLLLIGPTGVGKTTVCGALAEALDVPSVTINVSDLAETNWQGFNLSDALMSLRRRAGDSETRMCRSLIVLDEIDKVGTGGFDYVSWGYRQGKQESLLALLGGEPVRYGEDRSAMRWTWRADEALVVAAGVFSGLPDGPPAPADLVRWGMMPELVGRLGEIIRLQPLSAREIQEVLWRELRAVGATAKALGYDVTVTDEALAAVVDLKSAGEDAVDPRTRATLLRSAVERGLARMLEAKEPEGVRLVVSAADLHLPSKQPQRTVGFRAF